ncbi:hypothetical protein FIBSPDRAFT_892792 [Athelia psychrophila]|uniref:TPR-like protein n=1 Tax=Athelia psychrophila TaxID=1759441 RepID=A0A166I027_9AGAM|nr:hypothetical protein FIBSPDRAFT_892792 [Fibularhizoctonia sp. CBS 109695]
MTSSIPSRFARRHEIESPTAAELKAEADAVYKGGDYTAAYAKYSRAISKDEKNPILYSNRAACSMMLKQAYQAVDLDEWFGRAWARLATARSELEEYEASIAAWDNALASLRRLGVPHEERAIPALNSKFALEWAEYIRGRMQAEHRHQMHQAAHGPVRNDKSMPWEISRRMFARGEVDSSLDLDKRHSSAHAIRRAYQVKFQPTILGLLLKSRQEFSKGLAQLKTTRRIRPSANDGIRGPITDPTSTTAQGHADTLDRLAKGILYDSRVYQCLSNQEGKEALDNFPTQFMMETIHFKACKSMDPDEIISYAQEGLQRLGSAATRLSLAVKVREFILFGRGAYRVRDFRKAIECYEGALKVLRWVKQESALGAPDRDEILHPAFIRGVQALLLDSFMRDEDIDREGDANKPEPLDADRFMKEAEDVFAQLETDEPGHKIHDLPYVFALYCNPRGYAYMTKCYIYKARMFHFMKIGDALGSFEQSAYGAKAGTDAAIWFHPDDEMHAWSLKCTLDILLGGPPRLVGDVLDVMAKARESTEKMRKIWYNSEMAQTKQYHVLIKHSYAKEKEYSEKVKSGEWTMETMIYHDAPVRCGPVV